MKRSGRDSVDCVVKQRVYIRRKSRYERSSRLNNKIVDLFLTMSAVINSIYVPCSDMDIFDTYYPRLYFCLHRLPQ